MSNLSIDEIVTNPKSKGYEQHKNFRIGRLLGVGKWTHVHIC